MGKKYKKLLESLRDKYGVWQVFSDFVGIQALLISITHDPVHTEERERLYSDIVKKYDNKDRQIISQAIESFGEEIDRNFNKGYPEDILGSWFHELSLQNEATGQFFTPSSVADFMSMVSFKGNEQEIEKNGYMTVLEPASGSGALILSFAKDMRSNGFNYKTQLVVTAVDIDMTCVYMTYVQLSLYGIPAVVIHGNTLTREEWSRWYTPMYLLDNWVWHVRCTFTTGRNKTDEALKMLLNPMYLASRQLFGYGNNNTNDKKKEVCITSDKKIKKTISVEYHVKKNGQLSLF